MTEPTPQQREALLDKLVEVQIKIERVESLMENPSKSHDKKEELIPFWEIDLLLWRAEEKLIKWSIINNKIDI